MNKNNQLYNDQSIIKKKINGLYSFMYIISSKTVINPIFACLLYFIEDLQLCYFLIFDETVITMNDKIRNILKFLALDVDYSIFNVMQISINAIYFIGAAIFLLCVLLIHPEKFKENIITKVLRIFIILFNTIAFPLCTQIFARSLVPKGGKLAAYPDVSFFEGRQLFVLLDVVSFILYLLFQFIVFPFIYINPTPFNKKNALCKTYSFMELKYNIAVFILSFATVILRAYKADFACFIFIVMFLYIIYETYELLTTHPYYHKHVNNLRAGMWTMVLGMSIVDLFALLFGKGKSFFSIILPIIGVCSFVIGFLLSIYQYKKHIEAIYKRYKTKRLEEKYRYNRDHGITSSNDSENESQVSSENDHNEKLISVDSYDSSGNINNKKKHNKKQEVEESEESEEDDDDSSHSGSFVLNDRISERITSFGSLREIVNDKVSNEPIIVYNYINEFELSCRFIWSNETNEAFQLMKELYEESLDQYISNPLLYTFYSYYLLYIDARLSKSDKENLLNSNKKKKVEKIKNEEGKGNSEYDDISENENENENDNESEDDENDEYENEPEPEDNENEEALNEDEINSNNPDYLLSKALGSKLNYFQRYFVIYLTLDINEKKKEDKDYYKKEAVETLARLQHEAVEKHITILNILKKFFSNVKSINSNDNKAEAFNMDMFLEAFYYLKKQTLYLYQEIISKYPEEKSTYQLYTLFMTEVVNQTEGDKYMLNEGDSYMALNGPDGQQKLKGSQSSFGVSNAGGSSFGESENKKRRMLKMNMIHTFTDKSKRQSKIIIYSFLIAIVLYGVSVVYGFIHISNFNESIKNIQILQDMNYNVHNLLSRSRMMSGLIGMADMAVIATSLPTILMYLVQIEETYIPLLAKYSLDPPSTYPIIIYNLDSTNGNVRTEYAHYNGYELVKRIMIYGRGIYDVPIEEWIERLQNGQNVLFDYRFRTFSENFQYYINNVIEETMDSIYQREITSKNVEVYIIYILSGCLIFLSSAINFLGITPLYNNSKLLYKKTLRMFKYLLKGSINDIISRFEVSVESITETYDISVDNKKNKYSNIESENVFSRNIKKLKGYFINILLIASVLAFTIPIIVKDSEIISNLDYNLVAGERKKSILLSSILSYEVLLQDEITYVPGTAETLLYNEMKKLSDVQNQLYYGKLGLKPTRDIRNLDSILIYEDCRKPREECDTFVDVPEKGVTKNMLRIGLNDILEEYIEILKAILANANLKNWKTEDHMYEHVTTSSEYIVKVITSFNDVNFTFELNSINHIYAALEKFDSIMFDLIFDSIKSTLLYLVIITIVGVILIIFAAIVGYKMITTTNKTLTELVNVIFLIPQSTINMVPQFKRFIETGSFEEQ